MLTAGVMTIREGRFHWGHGSKAPLITAAHHPFRFWAVVSVAILVGGLGLFMTLRSLVDGGRPAKRTDRLALYRRGHF